MILTHLYFHVNPEVHKQKQATTKQRPAAKPYSMGGLLFVLAKNNCIFFFTKKKTRVNLILEFQVLFAGSLIKNNKAAHEALLTAMTNNATVLECIQAIETAA